MLISFHYRGCLVLLRMDTLGQIGPLSLPHTRYDGLPYLWQNQVKLRRELRVCLYYRNAQADQSEHRTGSASAHPAPLTYGGQLPISRRPHRSLTPDNMRYKGQAD